MTLKVEIKENKLFIEIDLEKPTPSSSGKTLVVATHNLSLAAELGKRCIVLGQNGRVLFDGAIQTALADLALLECAGLAHRHVHHHNGVEHVHVHAHDWQ